MESCVVTVGIQISEISETVALMEVTHLYAFPSTHVHYASLVIGKAVRPAAEFGHPMLHVRGLIDHVLGDLIWLTIG